jgi:hypothetical protein
VECGLIQEKFKRKKQMCLLVTKDNYENDRKKEKGVGTKESFKMRQCKEL